MTSTDLGYRLAFRAYTSLQPHLLNTFGVTMVPSPLPYGVRWTAKLIHRDFKNLATSYTGKFKNLFSDASTPTSHVLEADPPTDIEDLYNTTFKSPELCLDSSVDDDSLDTAPTSITEGGLEACNTLYGLLSTKLSELYASRERGTPLDERWRFRGAWLLLHLATQYCASNPSYDISRCDKAAPNEAAVLLQVLQHSVSKCLDRPTTKVSQVPLMPYTKRNGEHIRYDSAFSVISLEHTRHQTLAKPSSPPSSSLLWYTILAGATDYAKTAYAAECLLDHIWPEKDAVQILEVIGNPAKQLAEEESMELRDKLRCTLYPEYDALY